MMFQALKPAFSSLLTAHAGNRRKMAQPKLKKFLLVKKSGNANVGADLRVIDDNFTDCPKS
jgi:hypothetical protein